MPPVVNVSPEWTFHRSERFTGVNVSPRTPCTHRLPRKRAAGSAAPILRIAARAGRACRPRQWRDCYQWRPYRLLIHKPPH